MKAIQRGSAPVCEATILQVFLHASGFATEVDGSFGLATDQALRNFQRAHGLIVDGVAGEKTWTRLFSLHPTLLDQMASKWLSQEQITRFAGENGLEIPTVRAVYAVEAAGIGFVGVKPKILFEGHVFWRELQAVGISPRTVAAGNSDILFPTFNPKSYRGGLAEYDRLERAERIHVHAARRSASWGLFQILGLHAEILGYTDVDAFVMAMSRSEADHLEAFGQFTAVTRRGGRSLLQWLQARNWKQFAAGYNGPAYAQNQYDLKLAEAYARAKVQLA